MEKVELSEKRYNPQYDYTEINLKCREILKEKDLIPTLKKLLNPFDDNKVEILHGWGFNHGTYSIHTDKYYIRVYCASYNQYKRLYNFMMIVNKNQPLNERWV